MTHIAPLIRVFLSSTFADFQNERDALQDRVFPAVRDYARGKGARFLPIDLRWGIGEAAAVDQRTVRICLEEIRRCQRASPDFNFMALLGDRYGSRLLPETVPLSDLDVLLAAVSSSEQHLIRSWYVLDTNAVPAVYVLRPRRERDDAWSRTQPELRAILEQAAQHSLIAPSTRLALTSSITEREVDAGIFQLERPAKHALCIFRTLTGVRKRFAPMVADHDLEQRGKLTDVKQRLAAWMPEAIVKYTARWQDDRIAPRDLDMFCKLVEQHLRERIDGALVDAERRVAEDRGQDLRVFAFAKDRLAHFTGRTEPLERIAAYLTEPATTPLVLSGPSGSGKTTLLLEAAMRAAASAPDAAHVTIFIGGTTPVTDLPSFLRDLYSQLLAAYPDAGEVPLAVERAELESQAVAFLGLATADRPLVVIVDALDQLLGDERTRWIPIPLPQHVHLIVSILPGSDATALLKRLATRADNSEPAQNTAHFLDLGPLSTTEGSELLKRWLDAANRTVTPEQHSALLAAFRAYPNALYLRLLALEACRWQSSRVLDAPLPADTPSLLEAIFDRLESPTEHGELLVVHALGLLAAGKNGLAEEEVLAALSQTGELIRALTQRHPDMPRVERCPPVLWARLYADLEPLLTERDLDGSRLLGFYHRQAEEATRHRYLQGELAVSRHRELARYFDRPTQHPYLVDTTERPFAVVNERMVSELAYQQSMGRLRDELRRTLLDATFLQARIQSGSTASAVADTALAEQDTTLVELGQVLGMSAHVLDHAPGELVNQVHGRTTGLDLAFHHLPQPHAPRFKLLSRSLPRLEAASRTSANATHTGQIFHCLLSRDGTRLLTASSDTTARLWDMGSRTTLRVFAGHTAQVNVCRFTPDEQHVLTASDDATLRLWDIAAANTLRTFYGHSNSIMDCAVTPDGLQAVSASLDGTLRLWDLRTGETLRVFRGHSDEVYSCAISPSGAVLVSGSADTTLRVWDLDSGRTRAVLSGHTRVIADCAFLPDGRRIVSASKDGTLRLWDARTGRCLHVFRGHTAEIWACTLSGDGRLLLSSAEDGTLRLWALDAALKNGRDDEPEDVNGDTREATLDQALDADAENKEEESEENSGEAGVEDEGAVRVLQANTEWVLASALAADGEFAVSASYDDVLRFWDLRTGTILWELRGGTTEIYECTALPDGVHVLSSAFDRAARLWDCRTHTAIRAFEGHNGPVQSCQALPGQRQIISASSDATLRLWDLRTGKTIRVFEGHTGPVYNCAVLPDGRSVISASGDGTLRQWDLRTGKTMRVFEGHIATVAACAVTRQGMHVVSASYDTTLRLWEVATGATVRVFSGHTGMLDACRLSPDDRFIVSAAHDGTVRQWDVATGETVRIFEHEGYMTEVYDCALTPDGAFLLSSDEETVRLWDVESGDEVARWTGDTAMFSCALVYPAALAWPLRKRERSREPLIIVGDNRGAMHFLSLESSPFASPATQRHKPDETNRRSRWIWH